MKWKKAQYRGETSFGKKVLIFLIIIFILIGVSYYFDFLNTRNMIKKLFTSGKEKVNDVMGSDIGSKNNKFQPHIPEVNLEWCNAQSIPVDSSDSSPISIKILGEDTINSFSSCCLYEVEGFSICLNRTSIVRYCITSQLGGNVNYLQINDKYFNPKYFREAINDLDRLYLKNKKENFICIKELYG